LAFFLSWEALALRSYLRSDTRPPSWEAAANLQAALDWRETVPAGWAVLKPAAAVPRMAAAAPLYFMLLGRVSAGPDPAGAALWLNWFYLALLSIAVFGLAWHFRPDETALLSVVVLVGSPAMQELFHTQLVDLALAAWAAAAYWALLRSDEFRRWPGALAFGACFAVGMLHGWSFAAYFLPVLYMGLLALSRENSRLKVLAAAAIGLGGSLPWYAAHLAVLLPRLLQGPGISVASLWRDWAILGYLSPLADGLGVPFFACALLGLCFPQYRRNWHRGWVLVAWFVSSYVLWSLAPTLQLRYLIPCLPALAVAGLGAWPRSLLWVLAVVQIFTMVNFSSGWLSQTSVPLPWGSLLLFPSQPPARQDWHLADMLRRAQARRDPQRPFANLTLVANDARFNQSDFELTARWLKIADVRVRLADERLCEFSQFVVLKDGSLGPAALVGNLLEAAKSIKDPKGWFLAAYEEIGRWPLPDNSTAVLYQQKRFAAPPVKGGRSTYQFYASGWVEATDLVLEFGDWDAQRGVFRRAKLSAAEINVGALRLAGLQLEAEDLLFQPIYEHGSNTWGDVRILKLGRLRVKSLRTDAGSVKAFLEKLVGGLRISELVLDQDVKLRGRLGNMQVSAQVSARLETSPAALRLGLVEARLGDSPAPDFLLAPFRTFVRPLTPTPETPFAIEVPGLTLSNGWLTVP
jgi:4-amino-4-deoxy-L-arabinose transferase-like glycosyltransferase